MEKQKLNPGHFVILAVLFAFLIVAVIWASMAWTEGAAVPMSKHGWIALSLGVIFSLVIGCGLMALMFYSSNSGYDDVATPKVLRDDAANDEAPPRTEASPSRGSTQKARAKDMAAGAIDKLADRAAPSEEQASRKRRLLKGPEEFRESRVDTPKAKP